MTQSKQAGAALIVALVILLAVTMIGISAVKSGLFHERMAFNAQANELSFQAAETAISGVIEEAKTNGSMLTKILDSSSPTLNCVTNTFGLEEDACASDETIDARSSLQASAASEFDSKKPLIDTDAASFMDFQFSTDGTGSFVSDSMPFSHTNHQEWRKVGPASGLFSDDADLLGLGG